MPAIEVSKRQKPKMNREKVRAIFRVYRRRIAELEEEMVNQLDAASYRQAEGCAQLERRIRACRNEMDERERQEQADRWYREDQLRSATKDLERARSYGDSWGEDRALRKLRSIDL